MNKLKILFVIAALIIGGGNAAWAGTKTVYLNPGTSGSNWNQSGAWFALYMYDDGAGLKAWTAFSDTDSDGTYEATFNDTYKCMIICRMSDSSQGTINATPSDWSTEWWENVWAQTCNLPAPVANGMTFTMTGAYDKGDFTLSGNTFYLYNVGADGYLRSGNYYGSHSTLDEGGIPVTLMNSLDGSKIPHYLISTASIYEGKYVHKATTGTLSDVYIDSETTNWDFELVDDNVYKIKTEWNSSTHYYYWVDGETVAINGSDPGTTASHWKLYTEDERKAALAGATMAVPMNATFLIKNYYFAYGNGMIVKGNSPDGTGTISSSPSWQGTILSHLDGCNTNVASQASYAATQEHKTFDNYQEISLPNGIYHMSAKALYTTGSETAIPYIYATTGGNTQKCNAWLKDAKPNSISDRSTAAQALMNDDYLLDGVDIIVSNGSLQVGIKSDANVDWCVFDDFQLLYYGPNSVGNVSVALPEGGDMVANTWYYVDADGICNVSATTPANIVYTATGTDLVTDVSASLPVNVAGRFYVKSSSDNNLAVGSKICDNFSYHFLRTSDYKYLSRGGTYNTQAIADDYGIPVRVAYENNNINFMFVDNWLHLYDANSGNIFTDANTHINFALEPTDGGYFIINKNTRESSTYDYKLYIDSNDGYYVKASNSNSTKWVLEDANTAAHKNRMQSIKDAQAAGAATSAGIDGCSTQEALATCLSIYDATPISITGTGGTIQESYQEGATSETGNELAIFTEETVSGLTPGLYCLSVKAFERITWDNNVNDAGGASGLTYVYANDQKVKLYSLFDYPNGTAYTDNNDGDPENITYGGQYYPNTLTSAQQAFNADKYVNKVYVWVTDEGSGTGSIRFGIKKPHRYGNDNARGAWVCYNNFSLTYYTPYAVTINQLETFTPENKFANVTLNRTLNEGKWNTFCVPFAISNAELATAFGTGTNVAVYSEVADVDGSNSIVYFNLMPEPAVTANVPVLLKPTEVSGTGSYSFSDRTIVALPDGGAKVEGAAHYDFVGTYTPTTYVTTGNYYLWNDDKIYMSSADNGTYVNGTRAYIQKRAGYAGARIVNFSIEDEASGISQIEADPQKANATYNLKGQKVSGKMGKGIYVVDGKKVVIK